MLYFTVLILHIRLHLRWAFSILFNTVNSKALHDTTSELVFNVYRSLCDFTIILDYYHHLIYERNNNLWWNNLVMKVKISQIWLDSERISYLKCYVNDPNCDSILKILKKLWKYCDLLNFLLLIHSTIKLTLKLSIIQKRVIHLW